MEKALNNYLETIDRYLRPMPASERVDIVKEIKSEMQELQSAGKAPEEILSRLGDPKVLAKAYLGESIAKNSKFSPKKVGTLIAFYSLAGTAWVCILPITGILAITFILCGLMLPLGGIVKFMASTLGFQAIADAIHFGFAFGEHSWELSAVAALPLSILFGGISFFAGWGSWRLSLWLTRKIAAIKERI